MTGQCVWTLQSFLLQKPFPFHLSHSPQQVFPHTITIRFDQVRSGSKSYEHLVVITNSTSTTVLFLIKTVLKNHPLFS